MDIACYPSPQPARRQVPAANRSNAQRVEPDTAARAVAHRDERRRPRGGSGAGGKAQFSQRGCDGDTENNIGARAGND